MDAMHENDEDSVLTTPVGPQDHIWGDRRAPVTIVEYGDYECPHSALAHPVVQKLVSDFHGRLRFVFRHFPLRTLHPKAWDAAQAAEAAGRQGRFWEMHGFLMESGGHLDREKLRQWMQDQGLSTSRFDRDLVAQEIIDRVHEDRMSGVLSGVEQTPTFYINGVKLLDQWDRETLSAAVQKALEETGHPRRGAA